MTTAKPTPKTPKNKTTATRPKAAAKKSAPPKPGNFTESVFKKLKSTPQSCPVIAVKLGLVNDEGGASAHGSAKTRKALQQLVAEGRAVNEGSFKTSTYRLPN